MRSPALNVLMGVLVFVALAASAPAVSYDSPASLCDPTNVIVTVSLPSTVTVYQSAETVFVTLPCSSELTPTTTYTLQSTSTATLHPVETGHLTTPGSVSILENAATTDAPKHVATVTETTVLLITNVEVTPYQPGGSAAHSETVVANGFLTFVVENGTTYWLNGQTPAPSKSYVVQTSVVTVEPIAASSPSEETSTVHLTHYSTESFTIIKTLSSTSAAKGATSNAQQPTTKPLSTPCSTSTTPSYAGTSFTGIGAGGWNKSSTTTHSGVQTGAIGSPVTLSLMPVNPSQPVSLATTFSILSLPSLAAQSGFNAFSTTSEDTSTSANAGAYTSTTVPPYGNMTSSSITHSVSSTTPALSSTKYSSTPHVPTTSKASNSSSTQVPHSTGSSSKKTSSPTASNSTTFISTYPTSTLKTSTSVSSTASATPSNCGIYGDFMLTFDDIPPLSVSDPNPNDITPEPVFNPYHQFDFSDGFVVVPPPTAKYLPTSKPLFIEFIPNFNINGTDPMAGPNTLEYGYSGDIGNGDHGVTGCFGFNMYGATFGCDSNGPPCEFSFTGFRYNNATGNTTAVTSQCISIKACPTLSNCTLIPISLDNTFRDLDSVRINVTVASAPKIWWMDNLRLGWFDNSCKTGLCRISTPIH